MPDAELRDNVLQHFYSKRFGGLAVIRCTDIAPDLGAIEFCRICGQLKDIGLIEWEPRGGSMFSPEGKGLITAKGVDEIERNRRFRTNLAHMKIPDDAPLRVGLPLGQMSPAALVASGISRFSPFNHAHLLRLIRDGLVKTRGDMDQYFGIPDRHDSPVYEFLGVDHISNALGALHEAGLIEFENFEWKATPLVAKIQTSLQLSLSALASGAPNKRLIVSPRFETNAAERYRSDILVLMPFSEALTPLYQDHLKSVAQSLQMTIARADDFFTSGPIMIEIWSAIVKAKILIADCTGRNPNVFYEIGLAQALGKPVVLITQASDDVPFDLRQYRYIQYEFTPRGMKAFEENLIKTLKSTLEDEDASRELRAF